MSNVRDERRPFVGRTYLYIRDYPGDTGNEPLPAGTPGWMSPDVLVEKPDGTLGCEAVADQQNWVHLTVNNGGGIDARDAYVEVFIADPATTFTPAMATPVGAQFLTIPGYSRAKAVISWVTDASQSGHRCLAARASLIHPPDTYDDGLVFDVGGDRHVAQRNIHVVASPGPAAELTFPFRVGNPGGTPLATRVLAREVRAPEQTAALRETLGSPFVQFAERPLGALAVTTVEATTRPMQLRQAAMPAEEGGGSIAAAVRALVALVLRLVGLHLREKAPASPIALSLVLEPGEARPAVLRIAGVPAARPGEVHAVEVVQLDERERVIGGLTVVVRH